MDKYQEAVEELLSLNPEYFSEIVNKIWNYPTKHKAGCLFYPCQKNLDERHFTYGCLTQVRAGLQGETEEITKLIHSNKLIPENAWDIKQDRTQLEEFAKLQRYIDENLRNRAQT